MLLTRCPDCQTTFRVTDEALQKANGQVRCGRCATVFNAYAELREASDGPQPPQDAAPEPAPKPTPEPPPEIARTSAPPAQDATSAPAAEPLAEPREADEPTPAAGATAAQPAHDAEAAAVAAVVAEIEAGTREATRLAAGSGADTEPDELGPSQIDEVLASPGTSVAEVWPFGAQTQQPPRIRRSRWWGVAALLGMLALALQALHHFSADLAGHPTLGPRVQMAYARLGMEVTPRWDVHQYAILDWVATADPNPRGQGRLKISARLQNRAAVAQPFPDVRLRLKDRWEAAVASRRFVPAEYLPKDAPRGRLMAPRETARAEIEVVDPGPDAYGFELDVCVAVEPSSVSCGADAIFR